MSGKVIVIGRGGLSATLASLIAQQGIDVEVETSGFEEGGHTNADMFAELRKQRTVADFPLANIDDLFREIFGVQQVEDEAAAAEGEAAHERAYDAAMIMLDIFALASGTEVTTQQRVAMTVMLSNPELSEMFADAAEMFLTSGLFR